MHYVEALGIGRDDVDLAKVGPDWVKPKDKAAFARLLKKAEGAKAKG